MIRNHSALFALATALTFSGVASAQTRHYPLESTTGLRFVNATAEPVTLDGRKGLRITTTSGPQGVTGEALVIVEGLEFGDGVIEAEIAGAPAPGAPETARGFVGIAFRARSDGRSEQFYLRPTNGRAEDQERRNHAAQYSSHPDWPWDRLRKETPSRYEAYVDLVPGVWTKVRIEVRGAHARLYVHGQEQPTLIVNDLKMGAEARGACRPLARRPLHRALPQPDDHARQQGGHAMSRGFLLQGRRCTAADAQIRHRRSSSTSPSSLPQKRDNSRERHCALG